MKKRKKDIIGFIILIVNSFIFFICSNFYILDKGYNIKIPIIISIIIILLINIIPSLLLKKIYDNNLKKIRNGYRLLIVFLLNIVFDIIFYSVSYFSYQINSKILLINLIILIIILGILFWNGIIRSYIYSKQLGIRYRITGILLGMIPILHLVMLVKIIKICFDEVEFENDKIITNIERKDKEICKTKYPILFVHGIFFRDSNFFNYWGRIPDELIKNGATIYYGNHSSSLSVKDSGKEIADRIKEIIEKANCKKVNIIAHSKGGLDSRYAISNLGMDKYVASLTMINTPNHGCQFAEYLLNKAPEGFKKKVASAYNHTLKKLGDKAPDFIAGVTDLTFDKVEKLNKKMPSSKKVYYQEFGSILKRARGGRFPLNLTNNFVGLFDGRNDGLVGEESFQLDENYKLIEAPFDRGISHGDVIDLNRENIKGYDVREFYVQLVSDLKKKGY